MNNEPVAYITMSGLSYQQTGLNDRPLYTHPANACKHKVDDGACKECYLEAQNPYKPITNAKIEPTVVSYTHPVKELTDDEIREVANSVDYESYAQWKYEFARAILRKASEK